MLPSELATKIDDMMKADLLYWRTLCFGWLLLATKIVVVGLIFEGPEVVYEIGSIIRRKLREGRLGIALLKADVPEWVKILAFLGWMLIVLGVAGEWVTDALVSDADSNLQTFTSINLAEAQKEAAFALERAAHANERTGTLEKEAAGLRKESAGLQKAAEDERLARTKIEERLAGWKLSPEARNRLVPKLKPFAGTPFDIIRESSGS